MPELPEVETTVRGLDRLLPGLIIEDVWTDYKSPFHAGKDNIKDPKFFALFKKEVTGQKVTGAERRAKNVLIRLENGKTILIHMKMTGHLLYGKYRKVTPKKRALLKVAKNKKISAEKKRSSTPTKEPHGWEHEAWVPVGERGLLNDPFNKFIHFVITLSNGKRLAFSDMRKFAKVTLLDHATLKNSPDLAGLGPEPLDAAFTFLKFKERLLKRPNGKIKQVLMDQQIIAGIGNIYSDEILWFASVHPKSIVGKIPEAALKKIYTNMREILERSIRLGGDSMSDYRNLDGEKGGFHPYHSAYMQHGKHCTKKNCKGIIVKMKIGGRSAHFCPIHQICFN